jgi:hypothetical protein
LGEGLKTLHRKNKFVTKATKSLGPGRILWMNDPSEGIWTRDLEHGIFIDRIDFVDWIG